MRTTRHTSPRTIPPVVVLGGLILAGLCALLPLREARACWNIVLVECFDQNPRINWPFASPTNSGRTWRRAPNPCPYPYQPSWGFQQDYYDETLCSQSTQALWCIGCPPSNDPEFDNYPRNYGSWVMYGPVNLSQAVEARVTFYLLNFSETQHDSIFWGATLVQNPQYLDQLAMSGVHSGIMVPPEWQQRAMDLADLYNGQTYDSMSMLGQSAVYIFWWFISDNNTVVYRGSFLDNVQISWDDGGMDVIAVSALMMGRDSMIVQSPGFQDTLMASFAWRTCSGGVSEYPPFQILGYVDTLVVLDTVISEPTSGMHGTLWTRSWVVGEWGEHVLRIKVDTLDAVAEINEDNNAITIPYVVATPNFPPEFIWITPGSDTLWADTLAMLRWACYDSAEEATLLFYVDSDTSGCSGVFLPGGRRTEHDGPDSLAWSTRTLPDGRVSWPFVRIMDEANDVCSYAPQPVIVRRSSSSPPERRLDGVPDHFYLAQNFPNPFNPLTELQFGLAVAGEVTLTVHDMMGREVAVLVSGVRPPGRYSVEFNGVGLPSGLYFSTLNSPEGTQTRKMILLK
jgi:hypothetical protein